MIQCFLCTNNNNCGNAGLRNNSFSNLLENKDKEVGSEVEQTDVRGCKLYFLGQTLLVGYTLFPLLLTFCIVMCCTVFPPILYTTASSTTSTQLPLYYPITTYYPLANTLTSEHHNMCSHIDYHPEY